MGIALCRLILNSPFRPVPDAHYRSLHPGYLFFCL